MHRIANSARRDGQVHSGNDLNPPYAHVFTVKEGKVSRTDNFHDPALWQAALG